MTTETTTETATVRTYRVQYNPGADGDTETYIDAESYARTNRDSPWITFTRDGRIVAEIAEHAAVLIEEMQPLSPSEREELLSLREVVASLDEEHDAQVAKAVKRLMGGSQLDDEQTDWTAYHACGTCGQQTGEPCLYALDKQPRINPHKYRERLPDPAA